MIFVIHIQKGILHTMGLIPFFFKRQTIYVVFSEGD